MKAIKYGWLLGVLFSLSATAQNVMTSSPYSMFGIGEITTYLSGANAAMGATFIGMRGRKLINMNNPAGLTAIDTCSLLAETSVFARWENYCSAGESHNAFIGNFSGFSIAGRILPRWYVGVGLSPYSSVGYYFQSSQELEGSPNDYYISTFLGEGGLSKAYLSNAFLLFPSLSIGVNLGYLFGTITEQESQSSMAISQELQGHAFLLDVGLQYTHRFARDLSLTVGAVYGMPQTIQLKRTELLLENSTYYTDTKKSIKQELPQYIGIGTSVEYKKMTYALDYLFRQYSSLASEDSRVTFFDSHELSAGVCYHPNSVGNKIFWKKIDYKLGCAFSTPYYMRVRGQHGYSWRITAGLDFPVINGRVHVAFFYDRVNMEGNMMRRGMPGITVTYTLSELFHRVRL